MKYILSITMFLIITSSLYSETSVELMVFTQKGCSRCEYTIDFLKTKGIKFTEYPTEDNANNSKMWSLVEQTAKSEVNNLKMPVIIVDGTAHYSIKNLEEFLEKLAVK